MSAVVHGDALSACSHLDPMTAPDGSDGSQPAVLNPPFVEMLMGWPRDWTDCTPLATEVVPLVAATAFIRLARRAWDR